MRVSGALGKTCCALMLLWGGLTPPLAGHAFGAGRGSDEVCRDATGRLTEADADHVIERFRGEAPAAQVARWSRMTLGTDEHVRAEATKLLPPAYARLRVADPGVAAALGEVLRPLLRLHGKEYEIFILRHRVPAVETNSHAVLVMTTGFLLAVESDDELLTCVAHELAHEIFRARREAARRAYAAMVAAGGRGSAAAEGALRELSLIELECDAVAARTAAHLGYNPTAFPLLLDRISRGFPEETGKGAEMGENIHPPACLRARVIAALAGARARVSLRASLSLGRLKAAVMSVREGALPPKSGRVGGPTRDGSLLPPTPARVVYVRPPGAARKPQKH